MEESMYENPVDETKELGAFLSGVAALASLSGDKENAEKFARAGQWLEALSKRVCAGGIIGCRGGRGCSSDHK